MKKFFLLSIIFLVFIPVVSALLISPAKVTLPYTPDGDVEFTIQVNNDIDRQIVVEITIEGYEDSYEITNHDTNKLVIPPSETEDVAFKLHMPELEQFGKVRFTLIRFYQVPEGNSQVGATVALKIPIETEVPYPDKFVSIQLNEPGVVTAGDVVELSANLHHLGLEIIDSVTGNFIIEGEGYSKSIPFDPVELFLPDEQAEVSVDFDTENLESGKYDVTLLIDYDGESKQSGDELLIIGAQEVQISNLTSSTFTNVSTNDLGIIFLNLWVEDVTSDISVDVLDMSQNVVRSFDIGSYTLPSGVYKTIVSNLNLDGVTAGDYYLRIKSTTEGFQDSKDFKVTVIPKPIEETTSKGSPNLILIGFGILALIVAVLVYLVGSFYNRMRKMEKSVKKKKKK